MSKHWTSDRSYEVIDEMPHEFRCGTCGTLAFTSDDLAAHVERIVAARLATVEALVAEWEGWARTRSTPRIDAFRDAADALRAVVVADPADHTQETTDVGGQ